MRTHALFVAGIVAAALGIGSPLLAASAAVCLPGASPTALAGRSFPAVRWEPVIAADPTILKDGFERGLACVAPWSTWVGAGCLPCDATACPNGCCDGMVCTAPAVASCGTAGSACFACDVDLADSCTAGGCACGIGPSCQPGQRCANGACVCDALSCPFGCCDGNTCIDPPTAGACGNGGTACAACGPNADSCANGGCECSGAAACAPGLLCLIGGGCGQCNVAADCPPAATECSFPVCTANACGLVHAPAGTPLAAQTFGDCLRDICDGNGGFTAEPDDSDLPFEDGNQCTDEVCMAGTPMWQNVPVGSACNQNGGTLCDGNGACVECLLASDCPEPPVCQLATCTAGTCGTMNAPGGTPCGTGLSCNGVGACVPNLP